MFFFKGPYSGYGGPVLGPVRFQQVPEKKDFDSGIGLGDNRAFMCLPGQIC